MTRRRLARIAAPLAFLAAITVVALIVRAGLQQPSPASSQTTTTATQTTHRHGHAKKKKTVGNRYYHVRSGDTFASIAQRLGTTVARLEQLNPGVDPSTLHVGERIRVK